MAAENFVFRIVVGRAFQCKPLVTCNFSPLLRNNAATPQLLVSVLKKDCFDEWN